MLFVFKMILLILFVSCVLLWCMVIIVVLYFCWKLVCFMVFLINGDVGDKIILVRWWFDFFLGLILYVKLVIGIKFWMFFRLMIVLIILVNISWFLEWIWFFGEMGVRILLLWLILIKNSLGRLWSFVFWIVRLMSWYCVDIIILMRYLWCWFFNFKSMLLCFGRSCWLINSR